MSISSWCAKTYIIFVCGNMGHYDVCVFCWNMRVISKINSNKSRVIHIMLGTFALVYIIKQDKDLQLWDSLFPSIEIVGILGAWDMISYFLTMIAGTCCSTKLTPWIDLLSVIIYEFIVAKVWCCNICAFIVKFRH